MQTTIIPAEPGFAVATYYKATEDRAHHFLDTSIIAWLIQYDPAEDHDASTVQPITAIGHEPNNPAARPWFIRQPDGQFVANHCRFWSIEQALGYCAAESRTDDEREARIREGANRRRDTHKRKQAAS